MSGDEKERADFLAWAAADARNDARRYEAARKHALRSEVLAFLDSPRALSSSSHGEALVLLRKLADEVWP